MQKDFQMTRRGFITRLSTIAGGLIVAGSAADLLAGCGGGGSSPALFGVLPAIVFPAPQTPAQVATGFSGSTGVPISVSNLVDLGTITDPNATAGQVAAPAQLLFPTFPNAQNSTSAQLHTATGAGVTQGDLQNFQNVLVSSGLLAPGNTVTQADYTVPNSVALQGRRVIQHIIIRDSNGNVIFDSATFPLFRVNDFVNNVSGGNTAIQRKYNVNPLGEGDGHVHYLATLTVKANFDANGALVSSSVDPVDLQLGPFVRLVGGSRTPQISHPVQNGRECLQADAILVLQFSYFGVNRFPCWTRQVTLTARVCPPTGSGGGTT
jgi:hypothetical protein